MLRGLRYGDTINMANTTIKDTSKYYSLHTLLSRNGVFNFSVGMRGNGKTFAFKDWAIRDFLKTGAEFIYLRRYKTELTERFRFFDDILWKYPEYEFKVEGSKAYIRKAVGEGEENKHDWRIFGHFVSLATAVTKKSVPYKKVNKIGFDEFILERGHIHYLQSEVERFMDFYCTVDRWDDRVRVLFMANSITIVNPYFVFFNIRPKKNQEFTTLRDGFIVVQYIKTEAFKEDVRATRFGQLLSETAYGAFAVENVFRDDNNTFVAKKPASAKFHYAITFDTTTLGVWIDYESGRYFVSRKFVANNDMHFVLTKSDMSPNMVMIEHSSPLIRTLKRFYMQGSVYFDSPQTREFMNEVFTFLNLK